MRARRTKALLLDIIKAFNMGLRRAASDRGHRCRIRGTRQSQGFPWDRAQGFQRCCYKELKRSDKRNAQRNLNAERGLGVAVSNYLLT